MSTWWVSAINWDIEFDQIPRLSGQPPRGEVVVQTSLTISELGNQFISGVEIVKPSLASELFGSNVISKAVVVHPSFTIVELIS